MGKRSDKLRNEIFGKLYIKESNGKPYHFNFLALSTYLAALASVVVTMLCFIEAIQTFFIFPYAFYIGYAVAGGLAVIYLCMTAVIFHWKLKQIHRITVTPAHAYNIYTPVIFGVVVYVLNTWALSSWCGRFSQGYTAGLAGGDPNPANAAYNANPKIPAGDLTALTAWNFVMEFMTCTGFLLVYINFKACHAHMYPQRIFVAAKGEKKTLTVSSD